MKNKPKPTLTDVAHEAGVSKATASKVFNGRSDVSAETKDHVSQIAATMGYLPPVRRAPEHGPQIWVAITTLKNPYSGAVLDGILSEAHAQGALAVTGLLWRDSNAPAVGSPGWMRQGIERGADGFLLVTTPISREHVRVAASSGAKLTVVDPVGALPSGVQSVASTNWRGGVQATEHLLGLGHRRIVCVGVPRESAPGLERLAGYRAALEAAGLSAIQEPLQYQGFRFEDGLEIRALLESDNRPTAVFAANDEVACGVLEAARQCGLSVPADLSVIGFDDSPTARVTAPPLTTIHQPLDEMGKLAMKLTIGGGTGEQAINLPIQLETRLVVRGSTAPVGGDPR